MTTDAAPLNPFTTVAAELPTQRSPVFRRWLAPLFAVAASIGLWWLATTVWCDPTSLLRRPRPSESCPRWAACSAAGCCCQTRESVCGAC